MKDSKKIIFIVVLSSVIVLIVFPLIVTFGLSFRIIDTDTSNEWIGFWGGYLGGIISSIATIGGVYLTLLDDRKKRKKEEEENEKERKERRRLEIIPYMKSSYFIPRKIEDLDYGERYFVDFTFKEAKVYYHLTFKFKDEVLHSHNSKYLLNYLIKNIGSGSAGNLSISIDGLKVVSNGGLSSNDQILLSFLFKVEDLQDKNVNIEFKFSDVAGIGYYYQNETLQFEVCDISGKEYKDVLLKRSKILTPPELIQS